MGNRLYVGNLSYSMTEEELEALFAEVGQVTDAVIIFDRDSGRSKGFGFVEMVDESAAMTALEQINGTEVDGRTIKVAEANPRPTRRQDDDR